MPYLLIIFGVIARLIPHPWNFTPLGALGLFGGANCSFRTALFIPLIVLFIADSILGFYNPVLMFFVHLGFLFAPVIGRLFLQKHTPFRLLGAVFTSATIFFVLSNFGVWLSGGYEFTFAGLIECYTLAIPFYGATLIGDAIYAFILFGSKDLFFLLKTKALKNKSYDQFF